VRSSLRVKDFHTLDEHKVARYRKNRGKQVPIRQLSPRLSGGPTLSPLPANQAVLDQQFVGNRVERERSRHPRLAEITEPDRKLNEDAVPKLSQLDVRGSIKRPPDLNLSLMNPTPRGITVISVNIVRRGYYRKRSIFFDLHRSSSIFHRITHIINCRGCANTECAIPWILTGEPRYRGPVEYSRLETAKL
jgi:hypothetical protein